MLAVLCHRAPVTFAGCLYLIYAMLIFFIEYNQEEAAPITNSSWLKVRQCDRVDGYSLKLWSFAVSCFVLFDVVVSLSLLLLELGEGSGLLLQRWRFYIAPLACLD